ncbi:hypothetical protein RJ639_036932 [Escallonia herrerae]|uniref:Response regulatory domain-containing protein n=1 Tax=Escallonia herrerae TaxID=1293975 RepID=A0AA88WRL7_9ASTE|nr:hypothetical protein RJ639_036932 [Escallonia herrerae]
MGSLGAGHAAQFHVLAVDDSILERKLIERLLKISSFQVTAVDSGIKALQFLGLQDSTYQFHQESTTLKDIPVVIMSSENVPSRINRCLEEGAEEFILKPVQLSDLNKLKPHLLRKRAEEQLCMSNKRKTMKESNSEELTNSLYASSQSTVKDLSSATGDACIRSELEALGERFQRTVASQVELIFNMLDDLLDDLEVDSRLTVLERKVDMFAEELDDLIEERVAHFTKWEVQQCKDLQGQVTKLQEELAACKKELIRATRCRYTDGCDVKTWEKFKRELQRQFYLDSVDDKPSTAEAEGSIHEYVKEYSTLMLEIPELSERQRLCFFIDGSHQWFATELLRREPHDLAFAMVIVERLEDFKKGERPRYPRHEHAKDGGDGRSKSGSPKATDDERSGDEGRHCHHKEEKKHEGSHRHGDSRDQKTHVGPRGGCFHCAGLHYRKDCPHKGNMIAFLEKHKGSKGYSSSSDEEACMGALQMVNAFVQKLREETAKKKKSKKKRGLFYTTVDVVGKTQKALMDTGATHNFMSPRVAKWLGLKPTKDGS